MRRNILNRTKVKKQDEVLYHPIIIKHGAPPGQLDERYRDDPNCNDLGVIAKMVSEHTGNAPPVELEDESATTIGAGLNMVDAEALAFYIDPETGRDDEVLYTEPGNQLPNCIQRSYDKAAAAALDAHWQDEDQKPPAGSLARLQYEKGIRELEIEEKKLRGESVEMTQAEIDQMIADTSPHSSSIFE